MQQLRLIQPRKESKARRCWRIVVGLATLVVALTSVTDSTAEPKAGPKPGPNGPMGHHPPGAPPMEGRGKGGLRDQFGGPPAGPRHGGAGAPGFEHHPPFGAAGGPGIGHGPHGFDPEAMKARFDELKQKETSGKLTPAERIELLRFRQAAMFRQGLEKRKARLDELEQKKTSGKISSEEQAELDQALQMKARHEALAKRYAETAQFRRQQARQAKRHALAEYPRLGKDAAGVAEYRKHAERLAKLERAKELANADQRTDVVAKIDELIAKENQRHQAWLARNSAPAASPSAQGASQ